MAAGGEALRHFHLNHTFQWFPPPLLLRFSGALSAEWEGGGEGGKGVIKEERALNVNMRGRSSNVTVSIPEA